jgi:hypothetical protein
MNKFLTILSVIAFVAAGGLARAESSFGLTDAVKKKDGVSYMCSGIGESKDDPRTAKFPLKIVFATNSSALYSDVNVRIYPESGDKSVFEVFCDGAWLLVDLPAGKYRVTATDQKNQSRSCSMTSGGSQTMCVLRWPD